MLQLTDITRPFKVGPGQMQILRGLSLWVEKGEPVSIMGGLGSGEPKLMNIIGLPDKPSSGIYEIHIGKIRVGQPASVTGDGLSGQELTGKVASLTAQASSETSARTGVPDFPARMLIEDIRPEDCRHLAVGMSANLSVVAYDSPSAIVPPPGCHPHRGRRARGADSRHARHGTARADDARDQHSRRNRYSPGTIPRRCGGAVVTGRGDRAP
jgi:energy-coupling factor transporter ATP-binding protein EcfA2